MHLIRSHRFLYVQVPQVNLIFSYDVGDLAPPFPALRSIHSRGVEERLPAKTEAKKLLSTSAFFCFIVTNMPVMFVGGVHFLWPSFSSWHTYTNSSYYSLYLLPSSAPADPWPSWHGPYTTRQHPYTHHRIPVLASTAYAFTSCALVWPAGLDSSMPASYCLFLISYTWASRALALYGKCPERSASSVLLPCPWGQFPRGSTLTNSFKSWKLAFLKFRVFTLLFACPLFLKTKKFTHPWSLHPRLPSILTSLVSSLTLVTSRYRNESPLVGLSITWSKTLSSWIAHSSPCYFSSRCQGSWGSLAGGEPARCLLQLE